MSGGEAKCKEGYVESASLVNLHRMFEEGQEKLDGKKTKFYGWLRRVRESPAVVFVDIYDGTVAKPLNCVASPQVYKGAEYQDEGVLSDLQADEKYFTVLSYEQLTKADNLSPGCAVVVDGKLVVPAKGDNQKERTQKFELHIERLRVIGGVASHKDYPIQKSAEQSLTTLRQLPFMRWRTQVMQSLFRIRSKAALAVHLFMDQNDVELTDPNILTMSDCEGAGETFAVSPLMFSKDSEGKDLPVGLTVSSQLPLEASITGFRQTYTCQKSFRAEKSDTNKHLAEFVHVEYEGAFITLDELLTFTEKFVKFIIKYTMDRCKDDFNFLAMKKVAPAEIDPTKDLLTNLMDREFVRIKHCDAVKLLQRLAKDKVKLPEGKTMKVTKLKVFPKEGEDLGAEHEKLLVKYFGYEAVPEAEREEKVKEGYEFGAFVYVTHWPTKIKSFYMKQCEEDGDCAGECESFDLLAPRVGELFGGSMREWRFDKLDAEVKRRGMDVTPIQWFMDLRKSGSSPHGGWGMGFARMVMLLTGVPSVRDIVPFPVYYGHCPY